MDTRRAPQWIVHTDLPDQRPQACVDLRATSQGLGFPTPVPAKAGAMPTHESLGLDDRDCLQDQRKQSIQLDQEQSIVVPELNTTSHLPSQHGQLMSERRVLCFKSTLRLERRGEQRQEEA